jgi:general secretion pathway protein J
MMSAPRNAGFSLVEVLIALFITAVLAGLGSSLLLGTLGGGERLEQVAGDARSLELAHATLKTDLAQLAARPTRLPDGRTRDWTFAGGAFDAGGALLAFARAGWDNPDGAEPRGSIVYVEYRLEEDRLVRRSWVRADPTERTPMVERVLLTRVATAQVSFARRGVWADAFLAEPEGGRSRQFPDLVALDLEIEGLGEVRQVFATGQAS